MKATKKITKPHTHTYVRARAEGVAQLIKIAGNHVKFGSRRSCQCCPLAGAILENGRKRESSLTFTL